MVVKTPSLTSLGLRSLRKINDGGVYITGNKNLCYHDTVNWTLLLGSSSRQQRRHKNIDIKDNRPRSDCGEWRPSSGRGPVASNTAFFSSTSQGKLCVRPPLLLRWLLGSGAKPVPVL